MTTAVSTTDGPAPEMQLRIERDVLLVALARLQLGEFRLGWLAEADAIWAARGSEAGPVVADPLVWVTRAREMLQLARESTATIAGMDDEVAAAERRIATCHKVAQWGLERHDSLAVG